MIVLDMLPPDNYNTLNGVLPIICAVLIAGISIAFLLYYIFYLSGSFPLRTEDDEKNKPKEATP